MGLMEMAHRIDTFLTMAIIGMVVVGVVIPLAVAIYSRYEDNKYFRKREHEKEKRIEDIKYYLEHRNDVDQSVLDHERMESGELSYALQVMNGCNRKRS